MFGSKKVSTAFIHDFRLLCDRRSHERKYLYFVPHTAVTKWLFLYYRRIIHLDEPNDLVRLCGRIMRLSPVFMHDELNDAHQNEFICFCLKSSRRFVRLKFKNGQWLNLVWWLFTVMTCHHHFIFLNFQSSFTRRRLQNHVRKVSWDIYICFYCSWARFWYECGIRKK